jgi:TPP-dependent pyruvate/acetoin dehydrogenase alpha subunit
MEPMSCCTITAEELRAFEESIRDCFNRGEIRSPVHLYSGNEEQMIDIFRDIQEEDWVCCSWRSHYQCLLKGVPTEELRAQILRGNSICLCFPKHRVISSGIVGGIVPIALGIAAGLSRQHLPGKVHCFLGEMTAETGIAGECIKYGYGFRLPVRFIIEDNGKGVYTDTREVWGMPSLTYEKDPRVTYYHYRLTYPHVGTGTFVTF